MYGARITSCSFIWRRRKMLILYTLSLSLCYILNWSLLSDIEILSHFLSFLCEQIDCFTSYNYHFDVLTRPVEILRYLFLFFFKFWLYFSDGVAYKALSVMKFAGCHRISLVARLFKSYIRNIILNKSVTRLLLFRLDRKLTGIFVWIIL